MRVELEKRLTNEFPWLNTKPEENRPSLNGVFGCECRDGWYLLIHDLCTGIQSAFDRYGVKNDIRVDQIKEKFGALRFYYHFSGSEHDKEMVREIEKFVEDAENKSESTCEVCGAPGKLRTDRRYIETLCDQCFAGEREQAEGESEV